MPEYIDREAVYKKACRGCTRIGDEIGTCYEEEPCEELQAEFASAPAADVVPVRHGRMVGGKGEFCSTCSECGEILIKRWHYCPSCGAKMDGRD